MQIANLGLVKAAQRYDETRGPSARERRVLQMRFIEDQRRRDDGKRIGLSQIQVSRTLRSAIERLQLAAEPE